ncbi:hypothetical protein [Micromonospora carbonacea]|uniref:hypothetical protein n=1 Tax=Micromonospora carbonacea TaxID=47853 RepID=UPI000943A780|nr:hypothetical protein [Micromonospora carbonacea]
MNEFLSALVGAVAGGLFALVGSYLASRWQATHQRANLLHEARISLHVDLIADCQRRDVWLDALCDSYRELKQLGKAYQPALPLEARIELLGLPRTKDAWAVLRDAQAELRLLMDREEYPTHDEDLMLPGSPEVVAVRRAVADLRDAVHQDMR